VRTVLCYGDSNTWGYEAGTEARLGRWSAGRACSSARWATTCMWSRKA
jgi:hypothetical protein